jgi:hypothetical protein
VLCLLRLQPLMTCLASLRYMGAQIELVDISCLVTESSFTTSMRKRDAFSDSDAVWEHEAMIRAKLGGKSTRFGYSYNQINPSDSKTCTMFDFRSDYLKTDNQAYMMASKTGSLASNSAHNFDWIQWDSMQQGDLASRVYSINTYFGQPPASVSPCVCHSDLKRSQAISSVPAWLPAHSSPLWR